MESTDIRWMIGALFVAFLVIVVLSDLIRRKPKSSRKPEGFGDMRSHGHQHQPRQQSSWKNPGRH